MVHEADLPSLQFYIIIEDIARKLHPMRFKPSFGFMNTL